MPSTDQSDTKSNVPDLQHIHFPSLEESVTPSNVLSMGPSVSPSDASAGTLSEYPSEWTSSMLSKMKSIETSIAHSISPSMMLYFNPIKFPSLIISESYSGMSSQSVEPSMSSSSSPFDIPLLSNRYCHMLKGDIGASPNTVVVWSVTGFPPYHTLVHNFTGMNPGNSIPHNRVVD